MKARPSTTQFTSAFSLVEMLVVMGIVGLLIGFLLPTLSGARATARMVQCQSNLRQLGVILQMYANENNGWLFPVGPEVDGKPTTLGTDLPPHERWPARIAAFGLKMPNPLPYDPSEYGGTRDSANIERFPTAPFTPKILLCPSDPDAVLAHSYVLNLHLADKRIRIATKNFGGLLSPQVVVAGEKLTQARDYYMERDEFDASVEKYRHGVQVGSNYLFFDGHVSTLPPNQAVGGVDPWDPPLPDATSKPSQ